MTSKNMKSITLSWIFVCAFSVLSFGQTKDDLVSILSIITKQEATQALFQTPTDVGNALVFERETNPPVGRSIIPIVETFNELTNEDCKKVGKPVLFMTTEELAAISVDPKNAVHVRLRTAKDRINISLSTILLGESKIYLTDYIMIKDGVGTGRSKMNDYTLSNTLIKEE